MRFESGYVRREVLTYNQTVYEVAPLSATKELEVGRGTA
jgi:hypothetical protein